MRTALVAVLATHLVPGSPPIPTKVWRVIRGAVERAHDPNEVVEYAHRTLSPVDAARISDLVSNIETAEKRLEELSAEDVLCLTEFDESYPQRWLQVLGGKHPAAIFVSGDIPLLNSSCVGIVGSRDVDVMGSAFAREVAAEAIRLGHAVVSGGAKGVDQIAAEAALSAGGKVVEIVPDSLLRRAHAGLSGPNRTLVSPYHPDAGFSAGNAMGRNKLIYALSLGTVVVASSLGSGGTWSGAKEALSWKLCPVLVRDVDLPGNKGLIGLGGKALGTVGDLEEGLGEGRSGSLF